MKSNYKKTVKFWMDDDEYEVKFPAMQVQCYDCGGKGSTYLGWAAKDQPAFTAEDLYYEGPDFLDDYMSGAYDAPCPCCKGSGVELVIDEDAIPKDMQEYWEAYLEHLEEEAAYQRMVESERRMGC